MVPTVSRRLLRRLRSARFPGKFWGRELRVYRPNVKLAACVIDKTAALFGAGCGGSRTGPQPQGRKQDNRFRGAPIRAGR